MSRRSVGRELSRSAPQRPTASSHTHEPGRRPQVPLHAERSNRAGAAERPSRLLLSDTSGQEAAADSHTRRRPNRARSPGVDAPLATSGDACDRPDAPTQRREELLSGLTRSSPASRPTSEPALCRSHNPRWSPRPEGRLPLSPGAAQARGGRDLAAGPDDIQQRQDQAACGDRFATGSDSRGRGKPRDW